MAVELVEIVNPNGRKGRVAATSAAARAYKQPPSADRTEVAPSAAPAPVEPVVVTEPPTGPQMPGRNASKPEWVAYATHQSTPNRLSAEVVDQMNRDAIAAHFNPAEEA